MVGCTRIAYIFHFCCCRLPAVDHRNDIAQTLPQIENVPRRSTRTGQTTTQPRQTLSLVSPNVCKEWNGSVAIKQTIREKTEKGLTRTEKNGTEADHAGKDGERTDQD
jgi:hypothetical protein